MVNVSVYEKVTYKQIEDMKHTIGFDNKRVKGTRYRKYEPYRNYFYSGRLRPKHLDQLVEMGFMSLREVNSPLSNEKQYIYSVTDDGRKFLELVTGVEILEESD